MTRQALITTDTDILGGLPVFAGTRVPVKTLFDYLKANHPLTDFLEDFPTVTQTHALAVLDLSGQHLQTDPYETAA